MRLNQYHQRRRAPRWLPVENDDDGGNDDDDDHGEASRRVGMISLPLLNAGYRGTQTHTAGIYQARVSSVKTSLLIGAQYLL